MFLSQLFLYIYVNQKLKIMANMSYCRFQNTLNDLRDCYYNLDDTDDLSEEEARARYRLIELCKDIVEEYGQDNSLEQD